MTKSRAPAKLVSCVKDGKTWVATDSAGRRFVGDTKAEAEQMLAEYNKPAKKGS